MGWRRNIYAALTCACCLALAPGVMQAQSSEQRVSLDEARILANRLTDIGQPAAAREIALGVLQANPRDVQALVALARAELALGRIEAAERAAQAALTSATSQSDRFLASLMVADVFARTDRFTRSQLWLRRAQELAANDAQERVVANAYQRVRQVNPFSMQLAFGLQPSNNVNSGNSNDSVTFAYLPGVFGTIPWALPADDRPLSGIQVSFDGSFRYRIAASATSQTNLDFGIYARTYIMSSSAKAAAPDVTGESLSYGDLSVGIAHQWVPEGTTSRQYGVSLDYEQGFTADGPLSHRLTADFSVEQLVGEADRLSFGISLEGAEHFASDATSLTTRLRGRWLHGFGNGQSITTSATLARATSDDQNRDFTSGSLGVTYNFGEVLPQIDLATTIQAEWRSFDSVTLDPSGRDDLTTSVQLAAGFGNLEVFGFEPVATLRLQRNDSSVPFYETESVTFGVDFRSSF